MKQYTKVICAVVVLLGMSVSAWGTAATLPIDYRFTAGSSSLPTGVTQSGLGSDYTAHSPFLLRFDNDDDYILLQTDAPAQQITFGVKMVGGSTTSYFYLKGCATENGTYGDIETFTVSGNQNSRRYFTTSVTINSSYRYFKFVFDKGTNVGMGVLTVTKGNTSACAVTYNAEGGTCATASKTESAPNEGVTLPDVTPSSAATAAGWKFYGWATSAQSAVTTTAPTIVGKAGEKYFPSSDITLHAVFAKGEYTKVTSTSGIESGKKYLIAADYNSKIHVMTSTYVNTDDYYMREKVVSEYTTGKIHAAAVEGSWRYVISGSAGAYYIQDVVHNSNNYIDTYYTDWYNQSKISSHAYTISFSSGTCSICNAYGSYPYLVLFAAGDFGTNGSSWAGMMIYKETIEPAYCSAPKFVQTVASPAAGGTATIEGESEYVFGGASVEYIAASAAANSGYDFLRWESSANAKFYNQSTKEYDLSSTTEDEEFVKATGDATLTAYFYQNHSITYTLSAGVTGEGGNPATITKAEMDGFSSGFNLAAHYKNMTLTSVTMGGSPLTEGAAADYEWELDDGFALLTIHHDNIDGDIVITVSATPMEYTKYAFSCSELTLTPKLVTASTPIFITSAASKTVRSQDSILIVGNGLTPSTTLTFPGLPSKFEIKSRTGAALATNASGEIDAVAYIYYTPGAGDETDGLDKLTGISVSVGGAKPITKTLTQSIIGRHLPNKIVIAAKGSDNKWYALPSFMLSLYPVTPEEISVDNVTLPTKAYSSTLNRYNGIEGPTASNISAGNGQYVKLKMDVSDGTKDDGKAPLFGQGGSDSGIGRSGVASAASDLSAGWWWLLTQTNTSVSNPQDAKYQIKCANNAKLLRLWEAAGGVGNPKWGLYANGINELRLIPMEDGVEFAEAYMIEWGQHGAIVEVDAQGIFATKVSATIGDGEESAKIALSQTLTSVSSYSTKYNYTVNFGDGIDFAADESNGAQLTLKWYDSYDDLRGVSNIIIPKIIASTNATMSTITTNEAFWNTEVHVLPGDTLFADAGSFSNSDVTIKNLQIYPGATVKVTSGTLDVTNLSLRNGWTRVGSKRYDAARLQIKSTANLTHTNAYVDLYIDNDQFYPLAVPFPVTVSNIKYVYSSRSFSVGGMDGEVRLRYYDGASRAAGKSGNWKYYGAEGVDVPTTLLPSMGYAIAVKRPSGKAFSVLRLPLTFDNAWTTGGEKGHYTDGSSVTHYKDTVRVFAYGKNAEIQECNKGWNLIGNPYMAVFHGDNSEDGIYGKILAVTNKDDEKAAKVRYITIPNSSFTDYTQVNFKDGSLNPGSSFLIQAKDTCRIEFSNSKIDKPTAPARYTATPTEAPEQEVYIRLSNENSNDVMGLVIGEDYTAAYETNADLMKMLGELNTLKTYMIYDSVEMAYLAINEDLAREWIPVTVRIPETGEYTYSMTGMSEIEDLEGVYLIDYSNNVVTNLIENNYSFMATEGAIEGRFAINAIVGKHDTPTDIDIINAGGDIHSDKPVKFIYRDKVYILNRGVIYDSTGKKVREINK